MNGIRHISEVFASTRAEHRAALMPYFTLGYPTEGESIDIIQRIAASGADLIELGIPFSDPLADGPTIQRSTQVALEKGITISRCLEATRKLRERGVTQPLLLMGYYNPILAYGIERFVSEASQVGADGFIVPDLPPEETAEMELACAFNDMAMVYLLAPTSTQERIELVVQHSNGFVYLVSVLGVTGARRALPVELNDFVDRVRHVTDKPLAVGFGIALPEQARAVGEMADGVIVGSAVINAVDRAENKIDAAGEFVYQLREALTVRDIN